jgi:chemotaxis protein methyltransferase CheR
MKDSDCVQFLQWALPQLQYRWPGFRKVRRQVCKRIARRLRQLNLTDLHAYQAFLQEHDTEWPVLDEMTRITISRFYRDKSVFDFLAQQVLPSLAEQALARRAAKLKVWSAGCASGEEAYTLSLIWRLQLQTRFAGLPIAITATDAAADMIARARQGCYTYSSLKNLPPQWLQLSFEKQPTGYCLKPKFRDSVHLLQQDIRLDHPDERFDLVLCRNLVFTYFDKALQCRILEIIQQTLNPGGALVIGSHENLPQCSNQTTDGFLPWSEKHKIYKSYVHKSCGYK